MQCYVLFNIAYISHDIASTLYKCQKKLTVWLKSLSI